MSVHWDGYTKKHRSTSCSSTAFQWPNSVPPTRHMLGLWLDALQQVFGIYNNTCPMSLRLGNWYSNIETVWKWWVSEDLQVLVQVNGDHLLRYVRHNGTTRSRRQWYALIGNYEGNIILSQWKPVSVTRQDEHAIITAVGMMENNENNTEVLHDWVLQELSCHGSSMETLVDQIVKGEAELVCDGSFLNERSSSAFVSVHDNMLFGGNIVPGSALSQSAYRGELAGILSVIVLVNQIAAKYNIVKGTVTIGCDCEGAINAVSNIFWISTRWTNFDLLKRIQNEIRSSVVHFVFYKVKGHQDDFKPYEELDRWEQANIKADSLAKHFLMQLRAEAIPVVQYAGTDKTGWMIQLNGEIITKNIQNRIRSHVWGFKGKNFWIRKLDLPTAQIQYIWWDILSCMGTTLSEHRRIKYAKVMAGIAPVGHILNRRDPSQSALCPLCGQEEDTTHLWRCQHVEIRETIEKDLQNVLRHLDHGPSLFNKYIQAAVKMMCFGIDFPHEYLGALESSVVQGQLDISPQGFLWGFYHIRWRTIFNEFFKDTKRSPVKWVTMIVIKFWEIWDRLWAIQNDVKFDD